METYPRYLIPVLRSSDGVRHLVFSVKLARHVQQAGRTLKDCHGRAILLDVHDSGRPPVRIDSLEPLSGEFSGCYVQIDKVVRDSV